MPPTIVEPIMPSDHDARLAHEASRAFEQCGSDATAMKVQIVGTGAGATPLELPPAVIVLLRQLLEEMAAGRAVAIVPVDADISTDDAAELLHVSPTQLARLIDTGRLPSRMAGTNRRLRIDDVLAYKRASQARVRAALAEMAAISQDLGLE